MPDSSTGVNQRAQMQNKDNDVQLSKVERALLIHLLQIRSALEGKEKYARPIEILREGYSLWYWEVLEGVDDEVPVAACRFVRSVLQMYQAIERYKSRTGDNLEEEDLSSFAGFDGNSETALMAFARFEIERRGYWDELKPYAPATDTFNSHDPMRSTYEAMLRVFDSLPSSSRVELTKPDVDRILAAGHAAMR